MPTLTLQQRKDKIDWLIDKEIYDNDELVYAFVSGLYHNREIEECIGYVNTLLSVVNEKYRIYYRLWYISLLYLHGDFDMAKKEFFSLSLTNVPGHIKEFYLKKLGFDELYKTWIIRETESFIFHIHPGRYEKKEEICHRISRRQLGYEIVGKNFFGITLERKIHYFLWDAKEMKGYFSASQTCSCYGVIQEGEYDRDWHESAHVYNYLFGIENSKSFILEGIAVVNDGRKASVRLRSAQTAYRELGIRVTIEKWWKDSTAFRNTNSWITYTTAGYFVLKLWKKYGKEKLLRLAKYQTYKDGCRIYGESELLKAIRETEEEIMSLQSVSCCN